MGESVEMSGVFRFCSIEFLKASSIKSCIGTQNLMEKKEILFIILGAMKLNGIPKFRQESEACNLVLCSIIF